MEKDTTTKDTTYKVGSPVNSRRHHLFSVTGPMGESSRRSLCGRWLYFGELYGNAFTFGNQKYDCRECARRYAKHVGLEVLKP